MNENISNDCIIFGGTGFIGSHFVNFILEHNLFNKIYLADLNPIPISCGFDTNRVRYIRIDVRNEIPLDLLPINASFIMNFAAIHREPGHDDFEYFETNLLGAKNICKFAEQIGCNNIIFTSSISPYGVSELVKDEGTLPIPVTAYGSSKLVAEKIHETWQAGDLLKRKLIIVRPGVVFGPREGGNVSRLIKAVTHRYFFFMGNRSTRKAGVYVKELCRAVWWVVEQQNINGEVVSLFNMSMNPGPSIGEYVDAVNETNGCKMFIPSVPYRLLIAIVNLIDLFVRPFGIKHPFSPVRVRKLMRSNNILPTYLVSHGYQFQYSLESAFADWKKNCPEDWQ